MSCIVCRVLSSSPAFTLESSPAQTQQRPNGQALAAISNGLVQLYARYCGKGPTRAKTHLSGDTVVCVLRSPFTKPERTLLDEGEGRLVERMRNGLHRVMQEESRRIVEEGCGRKVIACLAATHADPDVAIEIFVLEPQG